MCPLSFIQRKRLTNIFNETSKPSSFCCLPIITIGVVDYRHCNQKKLKIYLSTLHNIVSDTSKYDEYKEKVKELEKELQTRKDTFEKMTEPLVYVCDCYQKFNVVTGMPKSTFGDSFGYAMQKEISDYMQDFYAGKVSREDLDSYFEKCCTSMRTYRTGQHQTSGTNEADNTQIVSECQFNSSRAIY